jgi:hypothetical protein
MSSTIDIAWVKARISNELGFAASDLERVYGLTPDALDAQLTALGAELGGGEALVNRLMGDVDALRMGYRTVQINDDQIAATRALLAKCKFDPPIPLDAAGHAHAWRLSSDDAQWVAYRFADLIGLGFEAGDMLRLRLNRIVIAYGDLPPVMEAKLRDRIADILFYLAELSGLP